MVESATAPQNDWLRLSVPAHPRAIASVQALLAAQASSHGFTPAQQTRMQTAAEEGMLTVLHYAHDDAPDAGAASTLDILLSVLPAVLQLRITNHGLPYDQSLVSEYDPEQPASAEDDQTGLSAFLMHKLADRSRVLNLGAQGQHVELEWWLPQQGNLVAAASAPTTSNDTAATGSAPLPVSVRPLEPGDAIHLARLMYRTYGYSYNPDMYVADRILERCADGRLTSWWRRCPQAMAAARPSSAILRCSKTTVTIRRWKLARPWSGPISAAVVCSASC